jgi:hypothetical protein
MGRGLREREHTSTKLQSWKERGGLGHFAEGGVQWANCACVSVKDEDEEDGRRREGGGYCAKEGRKDEDGDKEGGWGICARIRIRMQDGRYVEGAGAGAWAG